jgi:L-fuculose-phosphate aldolase
MFLEFERKKVVEYSQRMLEDGLVVGTGGNISVFRRDKGLMAITPGSMDYSVMGPEDVVVLDLDGKIIQGDASPSSEFHLHKIFYRNRDDIDAVVHTHSFHAATLSCMGMDLPPIHYMIACAGGSVRCAPYATFGTSELAENALEGMKDRRCVLLANHGLVSGGRSLEKAYAIAAHIEYIAGLYLASLSTGGKLKIIPGEEMENLNRQFVSYH